MSNCVNCQAALQPEWKFCIYCGTAVVRAADREIPAPREIPGAIRPNIDDTPPKRRIDIPLVVGILLGAAGIALVIYMAIVLNGSA